MVLRSILLKVLLISLLAAAVNCSNAFAECENLLEHGIYDIDEKTNDADRTLSFRQWFCERELTTKADAAAVITAASIPAEMLPVKIGPQDKDADFRQSYAAFCSDTDLKSPVNQELSRSLQKINPKMASAFNACISKSGLHAWITQTKEPGKFFLKFLYRDAKATPKPATVYTVTRFNAACENLSLPFPISGEKSFSCTRKDMKTQSTLWILASEPVVEGTAYQVGRTTYTPPAPVTTGKGAESKPNGGGTSGEAK